MTFWHRAITILLLMVFTPTAVLAGTALRDCIGSDGHRAIEFGLDAAHHDQVVLTQADEAQARDGADCSDRPLLASYKPMRLERINGKPAHPDLPSFLAPPSLSLTQAAMSVVVSDGRLTPSTRTDPGIRARQTTVLLV